MLLSLLFALLPAIVSEGPQPILDPKSYRSPSAALVFEVDPSSPDGAGSGRYALRRGDEVLWQGERPWTFWEATVTDSGHTAGYAYTRGHRDYSAEGEFHAVLLAPDGTTLLDEKVQRTPSTFMHTPPNPLGRGVFHHPELGRVVFRVRDPDINRGSEEWWCFELASGKELWRKRPSDAIERGEKVQSVIAAEPVRETPLTLVEWWRVDYDVRPREYGVHLALLDADLGLVWEETRAKDCTLADERDQDRLGDMVWKEGTLLPLLEAHRFGVVSHALRERVAYEVVKRGPSDPWTVREVERVAHEAPLVAKPVIPSIKLEVKSEVRLRAANASSTHPIRDIEAFAFTDAGALRIVRSEKTTGAFTMLLVDVAGHVLAEQAVQVSELGSEERIAWWPIADSRWLATLNAYGEGGKTRAWIVEERGGSGRSLAEFDCPQVEDVDALGQEGFVVLATKREKYTSSDHLIAFDSAGRRRWRVTGRLDGSDAELFSPEAIATTSDNKVVVLDNIKKRLQIFREDGTFEAALDLETAWGRDPNYPSDLTWDSDGGVLVHDFHGRRAIVRMHPSGPVRSSFDPSFPDGRKPYELPRNAKVAPDGVVWTHDGARLFRLDGNGVVDLKLGATPDANELSIPSASAIDVFGRILIQDERSACVHVFSSEGRQLFVCRPQPDDFDDVSSIAHLAATTDGGVLVERGWYGYVRFDKEGRRVGRLTDLPSNLVFSPASGFACGSGRGAKFDTALAILNDKFELVAGITRRPDRCWIRGSEHSVAPDGSIVVVSGSNALSYELEQPMLSLYSPRGEPKRQISLPEGTHGYRLAASPRWVVLAKYDGTGSIVDLTSESVSKFEMAGASSMSSWAFGFTPEGDELLALDTRAMRLLRLGLP